MVIVWRLRGNIITTVLCWIVWHNVHSQQRTLVSSSYRSNRLALSHWDPYTMHRGGCLELYNCNMVEWFWWNSSLISTTNWSNRPPKMTRNVLSGTLSNQPSYPVRLCPWSAEISLEAWRRCVHIACCVVQCTSDLHAVVKCNYMIIVMIG